MSTPSLPSARCNHSSPGEDSTSCDRRRLYALLRALEFIGEKYIVEQDRTSELVLFRVYRAVSNGTTRTGGLLTHPSRLGSADQPARRLLRPGSARPYASRRARHEPLLRPRQEVVGLGHLNVDALAPVALIVEPSGVVPAGQLGVQVRGACRADIAKVTAGNEGGHAIAFFG